MSGAKWRRFMICVTRGWLTWANDARSPWSRTEPERSPTIPCRSWETSAPLRNQLRSWPERSLGARAREFRRFRPFGAEGWLRGRGNAARRKVAKKPAAVTPLVHVEFATVSARGARWA